jgi:hypothetical protein
MFNIIIVIIINIINKIINKFEKKTIDLIRSVKLLLLLLSLINF